MRRAAAALLASAAPHGRRAEAAGPSGLVAAHALPACCSAPSSSSSHQRRSNFTTPTPPRWYEEAGVRPSETAEGFAVTLDGRSLNTPARRPLVLPTRALALAVSAEWGWQAGRVRPHTMPLTALAAHAIDEPRPPPAVVDGLVGYLHADSALCVPPGEGEPGAAGRALADAHAEAFGPVTEWAASKFRAAFLPSASIFGAAQPPDAVAGVRSYLESLDRWELAAAASAAGTCKSVLLGLALIEGGVSVPDALKAARLEEDVQAAEWGLVEGGHDLDAAAAAVHVAAPAVFVRLARHRPAA